MAEVDLQLKKSSGCFTSLLQRRQRTQGGGWSLLQRLGLPVNKGRGAQNNRRKGKERGRNRNKFNSPRQDLSVGRNVWFKITINQGQMWGANTQLAKAEILKALHSYIEDTEAFTPFLFQINDMGDAVFYVEDNDTAEAIRGANRRIVEPKSGKKMNIIVSKAAKPFQDLDRNDQQLIERVLSKRFDAESAHIDLSRFRFDQDLQSSSEDMALDRNSVMSCVVKILGANCPQLRSIDLSDNRLKLLDWLAPLVAKTKNVNTLILSKNNLEDHYKLNKLNGWPVVELDLTDNPLCDRFNDSSASAYISAIHRTFPNVAKLDEAVVEPKKPVPVFAIEEESLEVKLPQFKPGFYVNLNLRGLIETFLTEFYSLYDGEKPDISRMGLLAAYDHNATFTMAMRQLDGAARYSDCELFLEYRRNSHNINFMTSWERYRAKLVHKGSLDIISRLCKMPKTQHLMESFLVDVSFVSDKLLCLTLQGLFRDGKLAGSDSDEIRFFGRSFLVVPRGEGKLAIINDQLFITPMSVPQWKRYTSIHNKLHTPVVPDAVLQTSAPQLPTAQDLQQNTIKRFMSASGMKLDWARKCLEDNEWDFDKAGQVFVTLKEQGAIPADAFT